MSAGTLRCVPFRISRSRSGEGSCRRCQTASASPCRRNLTRPAESAYSHVRSQHTSEMTSATASAEAGGPTASHKGCRLERITKGAGLWRLGQSLITLRLSAAQHRASILATQGAPDDEQRPTDWL